MGAIAEYLLSITAAAIVCTVVKAVAGDKSTAGKISQVISGVFLTVTLVSPLVDFNFSNITSYMEDFQEDAAIASEDGSQVAAEAMGNIIKEQTEAYILSEAARLFLEVSVDVTLSASSPPTPQAVTFTGTASPYQKRILSQFVTEHFAIAQENQQWI